MNRSAARWMRRLLVLGARARPLAAVVHTPVARGVALERITSGLSARTGFDVSAEALDDSLLSLAASVDGLQIGRPGSAAAPVVIMPPVAPLRIDGGGPLDRRPEDRAYRVSFSIGQIF